MISLEQQLFLVLPLIIGIMWSGLSSHSGHRATVSRFSHGVFGAGLLGLSVHCYQVGTASSQTSLNLGIIGALLICISAATPTTVYAQRQHGWAFLQLLSVFLLWTGRSDLTAFFSVLVGYLCLAKEAVLEASGGTDDERRFQRLGMFCLAHLLTVLCFGLLLVTKRVNGWYESGIVEVLTGLTCITSFGLFPFHGWAISYFSSPRKKIMSPLVAVCLSIGMLREQLLPIIVRSESLQHLLLFSGVIGLLYFAVLLFGELRLKRISAYVYLTHASVTAIVLSFASGSALPLEMQEANFLLGTSGLWITASLLASRLGVEGVRSANGLNSLFPGVGVCYLAATLSLVGFPGTLGFFSEELLLGELSHNIPVLILVLTALGLNGYSCFRLFGRVFGGVNNDVPAGSLDLLLRERFALAGVVLLLIVVGCIPLISEITIA